MINQKIYNECTRALSRDVIQQCAERNGEKPFGYVLDYLKDMYFLPKPDGWDTAKAICDYFSLS